MRSFVYLCCLLAISQGRMLPLVGLQSSHEQMDDGQQIEEFQDVGESSEVVVVKTLDTVAETSAVEEEEMNQKVVKPWSRADPGKRLSFRRRHGRVQNARNLRQNENDLLEGLPAEALPPFYKLILNEKISRSERNERLAEWAEDNDRGENLKAYLEREVKYRKEKREQLLGFVDNLRAKVGEVMDVLDKDETTKEEKKEQIRNAVKDSPRGVDHVLSLIFPGAFHQRRNIRPSENRRHHEGHRGHQHQRRQRSLDDFENLKIPIIHSPFTR